MRLVSLLLTASPACHAGLLRTDQHRSADTCAELQAAIDEALPYSFSPGARWVITLEEGAGLACATTLLAAHPQPEVLELRGPTPPAAPRDIWFSQAGDGVLVDGGHLALLDGVRLIASGERVQPDAGVHARHRASARLGPHVSIRGFPIGVKADRSAVHAEAYKPTQVTATPRALRVEQASHTGIVATHGAVVEAPMACLRDEGSCAESACPQPPTCDLRETGHGLVVEGGAVARVGEASIACFSGHGVLAIEGGTVDADGLRVSGNGCDGLHLAHRASLSGARLLVQHNGRDGGHLAHSSTAELWETQVEDNGRVGLYVDASTLFTRQGSSLNGNRAEALAADRGGAILTETTRIGDETPGDDFPRDVCAGAASLISLEDASFAGVPYNKPVLNLPPNQPDSTSAGLILRSAPLFEVVALTPAGTDCHPVAP